MAQTMALNPANLEDLYSGYNEFHPVLDAKELQYDENFQQAVLKSSYGKRGIATGLRTSGPSRMGTAGYRRGSRKDSEISGSIQPPPTARPMTAVRGAGYTSTGKTASGTRGPAVIIGGGGGGGLFDPLNQAALMSQFHHEDENSPEVKIKRLEEKVNTLLEESILASHRGELSLALDKAKDSVSKERVLTRQKEQASLDTIPINVDLTFSVLYNLAIQYTKNEMYSEAINTYQAIVKNRSFSNTGRLKVNIGNIHFIQGNYGKAVKFFRMALDQVPNVQKAMRMKIMRNIGLTFVKLNQFTDAIISFEYIMSEKAEYRDALHLMLCHYALGDREKMKKCFIKLLDVKDVLIDDSKFFLDDEDSLLTRLDSGIIRSDDLTNIQRELKQERQWCISTGAKLIAPVIDENIGRGYDWCVEQIRNAGHMEMANDLEINKAVKHLKKREFNEAIETLKGFEKRDGKSASTAATNLSFLYLLQNEIQQAEKYADDAINADHYNAGALVNKGNCCFRQQGYDRARDYYKEALGNEPSCIEALYNLALTYRKLASYESAVDCLNKLNILVKNHSHILYQTAATFEQMNERDQALDWYQTLLTFVPSDPALLNRLADMHESEGDKQQAFSFLTDSYRYFPSYIPTIERIAAHYIEAQVYEKATKYLERASVVQPNQVKWQLMIAACYRRSGNYQQALQVQCASETDSESNTMQITETCEFFIAPVVKLLACNLLLTRTVYQQIYKKFPENLECLKFLVRISQELGLSEAAEYADKLKKLEKAKEVKERKQLQSGRGSRSASRSSYRRSAGSSREGSASSNSSGYMTSTSPRSSSSKSATSLKKKPSYESEKNGDLQFNEQFSEKLERPTTSWKRKEEEDFGEDEVGDMLPE